MVYIFIPPDENVVIFQTVSKLGEGEEIIYTEDGKEYSDEYTQVKEWLSENWYIGIDL